MFKNMVEKNLEYILFFIDLYLINNNDSIYQ